MSRLLLISNSTVHGSGYLDHAEPQIKDFIGRRVRVVFIPYALHDRRAYCEQAEGRFRKMGLEFQSVHDVSNASRVIERAEIIFIGGGNTFRLLYELHRNQMIEPIRRAVRAGTPYIGSSAGSIVACPSLKTTKDMPVVQPLTFEALGLVPFQISPHYLDPDPASTHMGETQEERIGQFLEEHDRPVVGLREGAILRVDGADVTLAGVAGARIFRRGAPPREARPNSRIDPLLGGGRA